VYSLGVIVYEMLSGRLPFEADGIGELLLGHMTRTPERLRAIDPSIPAYIEAAVQRALEKDPNKRYEQVTDFLRALEERPPADGEGADDTVRFQFEPLDEPASPEPERTPVVGPRPAAHPLLVGPRAAPAATAAPIAAPIAAPAIAPRVATPIAVPAAAASAPAPAPTTATPAPTAALPSPAGRAATHPAPAAPRPTAPAASTINRRTLTVLAIVGVVVGCAAAALIAVLALVKPVRIASRPVLTAPLFAPPSPPSPPSPAAAPLPVKAPPAAVAPALAAVPAAPPAALKEHRHRSSHAATLRSPSGPQEKPSSEDAPRAEPLITDYPQ
jgi:hypothetical protein